jgi:hypothetical protein
MENLEMVSIPAIVTIVCAVMQMLKTAIANEKFNRMIPLCSVILGAGLGVLAFYVCPAVIPADNVIVALFIGGASGWAATGAYETGQKLTERSE